MWQYKYLYDQEELKEVDERVWVIFSTFVWYAIQHDLPVIITRIKRSTPNSKSQTHEDGRAIDISSRDWTEFHINRVVHLINKKHKSIGAISASDLVSRAIIHHKVKNGAYHFHLQCKR